jgi:alpha-methylacyl-CoA racemase
VRPLDGVRVLDLTRLLPGAYATLLMADLGADVVKIEDPRGGDPARGMLPLSGDVSVYFEILNRNKRSVTLDLRSPEAAGVLDALVSRADVVVESFRPHTSRRLGVDAGTLRGRHPRLVHASITGFGQTGPYAERAAHDINFEALGGLLAVGADAAPQVPRTLAADVGAAMNAAAAVLAALFQRERTGVGAAVDVSIHESALSWLLFPAARELVAGRNQQGGDARALPIHGHDACYNIYQTADSKYVALGALEPKFWSAFCQTIGRPDLIPLHGAQGDEGARALAEVRALMRTRTRGEWLARFEGIDVCLTPVNSAADAIDDPHIAARGAVVRRGGSAYVTTPIAVTDVTTEEGWIGARRVEVRPAPALGVHTDAVLSEAGLAPADIARLRERKVI